MYSADATPAQEANRRMLDKAKRTAREVIHDKPGSRFRNYYRRRRGQEHNPVVHTLLYALAAVLLVVGAALAVLPGPAFVFFILAFAILAARSRRIAVMLDKIEIFGWRRWRKIRKAAGRDQTKG